MRTSATFWDKTAERYARQPVEDPEAFDRKIAITRSLMTPDSVVLDIGCGTGSLVFRLAETGAQVHGLDASSEMHRIAQEKAREQAMPNVTFHCGPFDETFEVFEDESLDGLCAYSLLHLIEDRTASLRQIHRLLKPGGFFVSSTVCLGRGRLLYAPLIGVMRLLGKAPAVVSLFTPAQLVEEIRAAGFEAIEGPEVGAKPITAFITARKAA